MTPGHSLPPRTETDDPIGNTNIISALDCPPELGSSGLAIFASSGKAWAGPSTSPPEVGQSPGEGQQKKKEPEGSLFTPVSFSVGTKQKTSGRVTSTCQLTIRINRPAVQIKRGLV